MKQFTLLLTFCVLISCKKATIGINPIEINTTMPKEQTPADISPVVIATDQTLVLSGDFVTRVHTTIGTAKIFEDKKTKKLSLVLEGFKTDAGPDLRIYLAEDLKANNFIEVTDKVKNGNTTLEIPATFDAKKQMQVLIWCKQFSVLFGSASLK